MCATDWSVPSPMDEKQLWSQVQKVIKKCERRTRRTAGPGGEKKGTAMTRGSGEDDTIAVTSDSRERRQEVFRLAVDEIMKRDNEINMDITLKGDMARAFHVTMAIGKYLWNKEDEAMVQQIMQAGVERVISDYNSEVLMLEAKRVFKPVLRELLKEIEDEKLD